MLSEYGFGTDWYNLSLVNELVMNGRLELLFFWQS